MLKLTRLSSLVVALAALAFPAGGAALAAHNATHAVEQHAQAVQKTLDRTTRKIEHSASNTMHVIETLDRAGAPDQTEQRLADIGRTRVNKFADKGLAQIQKRTDKALRILEKRDATPEMVQSVMSTAESARTEIGVARDQALARVAAALQAAMMPPLQVEPAS